MRFQNVIIDDVNEPGGNRPEYDAFLLYDDSDTLFAAEIYTKLRSPQSGLRVRLGIISAVYL